MEEAFKVRLKEDRNSVNLNSACFSKRKYDEVIEKVIQAMAKTKNKPPSDYKLMKKYGVLEKDGVKRLTIPLTDHESNVVYYVHDDELFDILMETHLSLDHAGRDRMMKELKKNYKNITYKDIMIFLNICRTCQKKHKREKIEMSEKSATNELNSICQVNLIDYQSFSDGEFKFILIYQECATKFCILKSLKSEDPKEVAENLIEIFTLIGAPSILQSDREGDFINSIIENLKIFWGDLQITYIKYEKNDRSINQEIENMVTNWMRDNTTSKWSEGLRFVQLKKNTTFHPAINKSPYEALFKRPLQIESNQENNENNSIKIDTVWKTEPLDEDEYDRPIEEDMLAVYKKENTDIFENVYE